MSTNPFGDNPYPQGYKPTGQLPTPERVDPRAHLSKVSHAQVNHGERARAYFNKQGWVMTPCETNTGGYNGPIRKHDLFGFLDFVAFSNSGDTIGVQVCSEATWTARLRKMCDSDIDSRSRRKHIDNLQTLLECGWKILILGFEKREKIGNQEWWPVAHWVDWQLVEKVLGRRRKK